MLIVNGFKVPGGCISCLCDFGKVYAKILHGIGEVGVIDGTFGTTGKFRVSLPGTLMCYIQGNHHVCCWCRCLTICDYA